MDTLYTHVQYKIYKAQQIEAWQKNVNKVCIMMYSESKCGIKHELCYQISHTWVVSLECTKHSVNFLWHRFAVTQRVSQASHLYKFFYLSIDSLESLDTVEKPLTISFGQIQEY